MTRDRSLDVAVTGVAGRFPGSLDLEHWWARLAAGEVLTTALDLQELIDSGVPEDVVRDSDYVPVRGLLDNVDCFDNELFRISRRDAEMMDPQHRLMLETAWRALEDAGSPPMADALTTAVFTSGSGSGYLRRMLAGGRLDPATLEQALHGTEPDFIAGLISYKLGLTGPALAVQTACSSGLVAVHLAVQALQAGDCDQAVVVAAGVDFPQAGHLHLPGGIHSLSGECRPFDEGADGVVTGSGVASVVLRRLLDVHVGDGPDPYGVILGTAINNDGAAKAGFFAPSVTGQEAVIRSALHAADIGAGSLGYLETHGTGTRVGDPIEWTAASNAFAGAQRQQIAIGALKANTGHLDAAAGLASLIRALLVVRDGTVAPVAGFGRLNPLLDGEASPLRVPTVAEPWAGPLPRRAGVSAFGIGGTNAHVIIEQPPARREARLGGDTPRLVLLSAADAAALGRSGTQLADHLITHRPDIADVAVTLATARTPLDHRMSTTGRSSAEVADRLMAGREVVVGSGTKAGLPPLVLLFPGQGTQHAGMALPYSLVLPGFAEALEQCFAAADVELAARLRGALFDPTFPVADIESTELAQPALFFVGYAAATALAALGISWRAVLGHSLGEITAACVAGALDLPAAVRLVSARGRAMQNCPPGAMVAIGCDEVLASVIAAAAGLELAAVNGTDSCVLAGSVADVERLQGELGNRIFTRRLNASRAFHSSYVDAALPALADALTGIDLRPPTLPIAANASGRLVHAGAPISAEMFVEGARRPVRFGDALAALGEEFPSAVVVEVGPGRALSAAAEATGLATIALCPGRGDRPDEELLAALGALWVRGHLPEPTALVGSGRRIHLPGYPFAGPRWLAPEAAPNASTEAAATLPAASEPPPGTAPAERPAWVASPDEVLSGLWIELLGQTELASDSDFFELGGDSLLVTHLARRVNRELGITVPLRDLLVGRTLGRQLALVRDLVSAGLTTTSTSSSSADGQYPTPGGAA